MTGSNARKGKKRWKRKKMNKFRKGNVEEKRGERERERDRDKESVASINSPLLVSGPFSERGLLFSPDFFYFRPHS
jgi:hypothetical protein